MRWSKSFLVFTFFCSGALAQGADAGDRYARQISVLSLKEKMKSLPLKTGVATADGAAGELQTMFLMTALAVSESVRQDAELSGLKRESLTLKQIQDGVEKMVEKVWESPELVGALGGSFVSRLSGPALTLWKDLVQSSALKPLLKEYMKHVSANLVSFVGFEAGAELMRRSLLTLDDPQDMALAQKIGFTKVSSCALSACSAMSTREKEVSLKVLGNMRDLLQDSEMRRRWWSFVARNRVETGNFMAAVLVMSAGARIGGRIGLSCPVGKGAVSRIQLYSTGLFLGLVGGIVGGVATSFVPKELKDSVTLVFQDERMRLASEDYAREQRRAALAQQGISFDEKVGLGSLRGALGALTDRDYTDKEFTLAIDGMKKTRESILETYFDRLYFLDSELLVSSNKMKLAEEVDNQDAKKKLAAEYSKQQAILRESKKYISDQLSTQIDDLEALAKNSPKFAVSPKYAEAFKNEATSVRELKKWTEQFVGNLERGTLSEEPYPHSLENNHLLEKMYLWGFKTDVFVKTMKYSY